MALNYPANPSDGDLFDRFKFNATKGTWDVNLDPVYPITISDTEPAFPKDQDIWLDSATGSLFIYYVDVDSSQWIQVGTSGTGDLRGTPELGLTGGATGTILTKLSGNTYDYGWTDIEGTYLTITNASNTYLGIEDVIKLNPQTISSNYTLPVGYNGMSAGPITIADGVTVTVPSGSSWSVV